MVQYSKDKCFKLRELWKKLMVLYSAILSTLAKETLRASSKSLFGPVQNQGMCWMPISIELQSHILLGCCCYYPNSLSIIQHGSVYVQWLVSLKNEELTLLKLTLLHGFWVMYTYFDELLCQLTTAVTAGNVSGLVIQKLRQWQQLTNCSPLPSLLCSCPLPSCGLPSAAAFKAMLCGSANY